VFNRDAKLEIIVSMNELALMFKDAAKVHRDKAKVFRGLAEKMEDGKAEAVEAWSDFQAEYGSTVSNKVQDAKKGLLDQARSHENKAKEKEFISTHLPNEVQRLTANELQDIWNVL
jgi:hypothetical protein